MTAPTVSICLPNLNMAEYLEECIQSALNQTFQDVEILILDSYSDDRSWEIISNYANRHKKINAFQAPRGIYESWNRLIQRARGKYIYILTSDDNMVPECLEKMVAALEVHPECDIATCKLVTMDERGVPKDGAWERYLPVKGCGDVWDRSHVRQAPLDFIYQCLWVSVYISITQLLIRRAVFDRVGYFRTDLGSEADVEWNMRASLVCNRIHVPEFLATWRRSGAAATKATRWSDPEWPEAIRRMVAMALKRMGPAVPEPIRRLGPEFLTMPQAYNALCLESRRGGALPGKAARMLKRASVNRMATGVFLRKRLAGRPNVVHGLEGWREQAEAGVEAEKRLHLE